MNNKGNMTIGNPGKLIFRFAIPMMIGNVVQQLYSMVDSAVVGRFVGKNALAAIGATQSVLMLIICLIIGMTMGVCICTAQYYGAGDEQKVKYTAGTAVYIAFIMWGFIATLGFVITGPVLRLLKTPEEIRDLARLYLIINTGTSIAPTAYNLTANIMRSLGDSKSSLYALICSSLLNIVLDLLFVCKFSWGVAGAAWATVISQFVSCMVNLIRIYYKHPVLHLSKDDLKIRWPIVKRIFGIGLPMAFQNCVESVGMLGVQGVINTCGTDTIAAFTAGGKIDQLALMPLNSLGMAVSTYVGQNYGKGDGQRIHQGVRAGSLQVAGVGLLLTAVIFSCRGVLARFFIDASETEVIAVAGEYLGIVSLFYVICGLMYVFLNTFRGMGKMKISTLGSCLNPILKMVAAFALNMAFGRKAIWFAWPIGWIAALSIPAFSYFFGRGVEKALAEKAE